MRLLLVVFCSVIATSLSGCGEAAKEVVERNKHIAARWNDAVAAVWEDAAAAPPSPALERSSKKKSYELLEMMGEKEFMKIATPFARARLDERGGVRSTDAEVQQLEAAELAAEIRRYVYETLNAHWLGSAAVETKKTDLRIVWLHLNNNPDSILMNYQLRAFTHLQSAYDDNTFTATAIPFAMELLAMEDKEFRHQFFMDKRIAAQKRVKVIRAHITKAIQAAAWASRGAQHGLLVRHT